jgi:hypothetical protein
MSPPTMLAYEVSLGTLADQIGVAWYGSRQGHEAIFLRFADENGRIAGDVLQLTDQTRDAFEPDLQFLGLNPVVAWYEKDAQGGLTAHLALFDRQGHALWHRQLSAPGNAGRNPVVRVHGEHIWIAWIEMSAGAEPAVHAAQFDAQGQPSRAPQRVGPASRDTWNLNAALDDQGRFYVVYDAKAGSRASELQLLRIDDTAVKQVRLGSDDGFGSVYPDLSLSGGRAALTWFDYRDGNAEIYLFAGMIEDLFSADHGSDQRITHTSAESTGAYVAWNGSKIGLAWCDASAGQQEIYFQSFDAQGHAFGQPRRLTYTAAQSLIPAIRPWHDGFAIGWNEYLATKAAGGHDRTLRSVAMLRIVH